MPNDTISDALKEAWALAPVGVVYLETLQISHASLGSDTIYLVKDRVDHALLDEDGIERVFKAAGFRVSLPPIGDNGVQELGLAMDNTDQRISDFIKKAKEYQSPVKVTFRPYISTENTPQMDPPLQLNLTDIVVTDVEVTGRCTFDDIINKAFPTELYTRSRFPSLANL